MTNLPMPSSSDTLPLSSFAYRFGRIVLLAFEEVLGREAFDRVLEETGDLSLKAARNSDPAAGEFHLESFGRVEGTLDAIYGAQAGRGMSLRAGRITLRKGLREIASTLTSSPQCRGLRSLPLQSRIHRGAELLSEVFNRGSDQVVRLTAEGSALLWTHERCPYCFGRHTPQACCHLLVGTFQEGLAWLSGGKHFAVDEIACTARGDPACTFRLATSPLD
jgi:predicted hydrocarbon binding protein